MLVGHFEVIFYEQLEQADSKRTKIVSSKSKPILRYFIEFEVLANRPLESSDGGPQPCHRNTMRLPPSESVTRSVCQPADALLAKNSGVRTNAAEMLPESSFCT
jgi:hypothetical protein